MSRSARIGDGNVEPKCLKMPPFETGQLEMLWFLSDHSSNFAPFSVLLNRHRRRNETISDPVN